MKNYTGWAEINGWDCWIEDGRVVRTMHDGQTAYIYKASRRGGHDRVEPTAEAFKRGDYRVM